MYIWRDIEDDWLGDGARPAVPDHEVVRLFNVVAICFGREWVEAQKHHTMDATVQGTGPTLFIPTLGQFIESLEGIPDITALLSKVKAGNEATRAELIAIHLVRSQTMEVTIEIEPEIVVGG